MQRLRPKLTYANVIATVALFIALGGGAYAATQLPKNSVGPKQLKRNAVTPAKLSKASKSTLSGPAGPAGPAGATGPKGDKGDRGENGEAASTMWAVVNADGTLRRGKGVKSVSGSPGTFSTVEFTQPVASCAILASLGRNGASFVKGEVNADEFTVNGFANNKVLVATADSAGTATNKPFHVAVIC